MGKSDYVLEPILRAFEDDAELSNSAIRSRVASALNLSEAEIGETFPGNPTKLTQLGAHVAQGLKTLQKPYGHLEKTRETRTDKFYRLTLSGVRLAASPGPLGISDIKNKQSSTSARPKAEDATGGRKRIEPWAEVVSENELEPPEPIVDPEPHPPSSYSMADAMEDLFLPKRRFHDILNSIRSRRNLILQGPPGVGKTFIAKRIAYSLIGRKDDRTVEAVQFHQSYAYEDFVQGFRPNETGGFTRRDRVFFEFCGRAEQDRETPHVFIIDEINRGNLSRIFGELLMLIESDKRGPEHAVRLTYQEAGESFSVPENVHILGLMNTADRSLAVVDHALRRRFAFEELEPQFDGKFQDYLRHAGVIRDLIGRIVKDMRDLNEKIRRDDDLGHGFEVGHSYFVPQRGERADENWRRHRIRSQILPLLREYWFDRKDEVEKWEKRLLDLPDGD